MDSSSISLRVLLLDIEAGTAQNLVMDHAEVVLAILVQAILVQAILVLAILVLAEVALTQALITNHALTNLIPTTNPATAAMRSRAATQAAVEEDTTASIAAEAAAATAVRAAAATAVRAAANPTAARAAANPIAARAAVNLTAARHQCVERSGSRLLSASPLPPNVMVHQPLSLVTALPSRDQTITSIPPSTTHHSLPTERT